MPPNDVDPGPAQDSAMAFSTLLVALDDGRLHADLSKEAQRINEEMSNLALDGADKVKGKLTITVDFLLAGGVWEIKGEFATKLPKPPRRRTVMWSTETHNFTQRNPRQTELFRDVTFAKHDGMRAI